MIKKFNKFIKESIRDEIDPYGEEIWDDDNRNLIFTEGDYRFRNYYRCTDCGEEWYDDWDSTCDDECPQCGTIMTPMYSEDI